MSQEKVAHLGHNLIRSSFKPNADLLGKDLCCPALSSPVDLGKSAPGNVSIGTGGSAGPILKTDLPENRSGSTAHICRELGNRGKIQMVPPCSPEPRA